MEEGVATIIESNKQSIMIESAQYYVTRRATRGDNNRE
jgi:hypothetical protein